MSVGVGFTMKQAKVFFRRQELLSATEKAQIRGLKSIGAFTMRVARRSMRKGRFLSVSEYPEDLRQLMRVGLKRVRGQPNKPVIEDVFPRPRRHSVLGQAPLWYGKQLRSHTLYFADPAKMSVVTGPAKLSGIKQEGTPELLELGGTRTEELTKWKKFYVKGKPRIRLVANGTGSVTYKGRGFMLAAHNIAVGSLVPQIWEGSIK